MNVLKVSEISAEKRDGATKQFMSTLMCFMFKKQQWELKFVVISSSE
jgi:hypothetical protein